MILYHTELKASITNRGLPAMFEQEIRSERLRPGDWPLEEPLFGKIVTSAAGLSSARAALLTTLLHDNSPADWGGHEVLWPLWADEALRRAYNMVQLVRSLDYAVPSDSEHCQALEEERKLARALATAIASLKIVEDKRRQPCSDTLRCVVRTLAELFASSDGAGIIRTHIERIRLPEYKRRALVLAAGELVIDALMHGYGEPVAVMLSRPDERTALLSIAGGLTMIPRDERICGIRDLAGLLESKLRFRRISRRQLCAEIAFPVSA
jgi:hypothetical protein